MFSLPDTLKRALNALAFDNVGNLGEMRRMLREPKAEPATQPKLRLVATKSAPATHFTAISHILAR